MIVISNILAWLVTGYILLQVSYLLSFSLVATLTEKSCLPHAADLRRFRIFIPGYKEDAVIVSTVRAALEQDYPIDLFEIVVIADSFSQHATDALKSMPVRLVEVSFEKSTKGKALQKAIDATQHNPVDVVVILDADNHMATDFLHAVNNAFANGYKAVQGHRTAKSRATSFAFLDACAEEINNHIFRRGHVAVGLPAALIGSGMAFDWKQFVQILKNIGDTSGEDKELEFCLAREGEKIAFLDGVYVYDEKVAEKDVFTKQRSRWLAMQVEYFEKYFREAWVQLFRGNVAFFDKAFQTFLLPRVMLFVMLCLWTAASFVWLPQFVLLNLILLLALSIALLLGIPRKWYKKELLAAFLQIPAATVGILKSASRIGFARKNFIHTPHGENPF